MPTKFIRTKIISNMHNPITCQGYLQNFMKVGAAVLKSCSYKSDGQTAGQSKNNVSETNRDIIWQIYLFKNHNHMF